MKKWKNYVCLEHHEIWKEDILIGTFWFMVLSFQIALHLHELRDLNYGGMIQLVFGPLSAAQNTWTVMKGYLVLQKPAQI